MAAMSLNASRSFVNYFWLDAWAMAHQGLIAQSVQVLEKIQKA